MSTGLGLAVTAIAAAAATGLAAKDSEAGSTQRAIAELRAASNRGIAAHQVEAAVAPFAPDAVFVFSNGSSAVGRAAMAAQFQRDFADPAFVTYVRQPRRIGVSDTGARAVEHGVWTAIWREPAGETRYGGDYTAHWARGPGGWAVRGELYVKLRCKGPRCTP